MAQVEAFMELPWVKCIAIMFWLAGVPMGVISIWVKHGMEDGLVVIAVALSAGALGFCIRSLGQWIERKLA